MQVEILKYQNILDVTIQEIGTMETAFEVAAANGMSLTDDPTVSLIIPDNFEKEQRVVDTLFYNHIKPATAITDIEQVESPYGGIGYMKIEYDFIIS